MTKTYVEYDSNNSGGHWWLKDDDWKALEKSGWKIQWVWLTTKYDEKSNEVRDDDGTPLLIKKSEAPQKYSWDKTKEGERWLGALATKAYRAGLSLREAADEWERITGQSATDPGCPCCGQPHNFTQYTETGDTIDSGPHTSYSASW